MDPLKKTYDVLAADSLRILNTISPPPSGVLPRSSASRPAPLPQPSGSEGSSTQTPATTGEPAEPKPPSRDLYLLLREHHHQHPKLDELWTQLTTIPDWVSWPQIARGQDVFYRYCGPALTGLAYQSLLGGMGAARVVETLARTGGFSTKVARRRLFETTQHILQCTRSLESIQPGGEGFASTVRVRLLHAAVRERILGLAKERPAYYNVEEWGIPINDLDSIATIGTFSSTLIWMSFPRQGIFLSQQEKDDYVALWRYIAYLVGCPDSYFASTDRARAVAESLLYEEVRPSDMSALLANNIIKSLEDQPPGYASADMLTASARWLNGRELGDALQLARPGWYYYSLILGQCMFFVILTTLHQLVPGWDRSSIERMRKNLLPFIVDSSWGLDGQLTTFDFKYVPEYHTITEMAKAEERPRMRGIEARNLRWLFYGLLGAGVVGYGSFWIGKVTLKGVWWIGLQMAHGIRVPA